MTAGQMQEALNQAPCGFLSLSDEGQILAANRSLSEWLGEDAAALDGRPFEAILSEESRLAYQRQLLPRLRKQGRAEDVRLQLRGREDDQGRHVLVSAVCQVRPEGRITHCVLLPLAAPQALERELMEARRAAEEASAAKAKFLSVVSHELRTPLQAILGYADILSMGFHGPVTEQQRNDLGHIKRATHHLVRLINEILDFSRLESGQLSVKVKPVLLAPVVEQAASMLRPLMADGGMQFQAEGIDASLAVAADAERLQQILLNLLSNAVQVTPRGGTVRVCSRREGDAVHIEVIDTGPGIPPEEQERIFLPFVHTERRRKDGAERGAGLGLAISLQLARQMGGELHVTSTVDAGSTFTLVLQAAEAGTA